MGDLFENYPTVTAPKRADRKSGNLPPFDEMFSGAANSELFVSVEITKEA